MSVDGRLSNAFSRDASRVDVDVDRFLDSVVTGGRRRQRIRRGGMAVAALIAVVALAAPAVPDAIRHDDQPAAPVPAAIEGTYAVRIGPQTSSAHPSSEPGVYGS